MQTPHLSAVLPATPPHAVHAANHGDPDTAASQASFSHVLTHEHAKNASAKGQQGSAEPATTGGKKPPAGKADSADIANEALAEAAAEQGMTLPQIALNIAAEVAAVRQSGLATALKGHGATATAAEAARDMRALPSRLPQISAADAALASAPQKTPSAVAVDTLSGVLTSAGTRAGAAVGTPGTNHASQQAPLGPGKAASIAGAKQAVLTMQARLQANSGEHQPKVGAALPEVFTPFLTSASAKAAPDVAGTAGLPDVSVLQTSSAPTATGVATGLLLPQAGPPTGPQTLLPTVAAPLSSPQWASEFGRQVVSFTQGGHNMPHTAELRLDPPELGPLRISINLNDNVAHAVFVSAHAAVRQSVENALPQLQQMLAQAGISLGQTSVNDQGQPGQAFQESGQTQGRSGATGVAGGATGTVASSATTRSPAPDALIDTFA